MAETGGGSSGGYRFVPLAYDRPELEAAAARQRDFLATMRRRRSIRAFSPDPVPFHFIETAIATAATAPSGANQQPWTFVVVRDPDIKRRLRLAAEAEERDNYERRFPEEWLAALAPLGTDWHKEYLEIAPYVIVVFAQSWGVGQAPQASEGADTFKHYYVQESVGIATGLLIASLTAAGLAVLTHTPSPMGFLNELLDRPRNERGFVVLPVGYPADDCRVPVIPKKSLQDVMVVR